MRVPSPVPTRPRRRRPLVVAGAITVLAIVLLGSSASFYTEILWFRETGYERVLWTGLRTQFALGAAFGVIFALLLLLNLWIVHKITNPARLFTVPDQVLERYRATLRPYTRWVVIGLAVMFGLFAGTGASVRWRDWLLYQNATNFGSTDPVFNKDIGFFVFKLPFQQFLFAWGFSTLIVMIVVVGAAHYFMGGIRPQARGERVAPEVRAHLSVLMGLAVLLKAWGYRLDQFNLLYSPRGQVTGASYTDINAQLPALKLLVIIAIACSVFFFLNARLRNWILPIGGIAILALMSVIAGGAYPAAVQRFRVTPNERLRERPFIARNIEATRKAYAIDGVTVKQFGGTARLKPDDVNSNRATIENIRLWDPDVLGSVYLSLQRIKQYYEFLDVDVDRYAFPEGRRLVMLSPREIFPDGLPAEAQTWLNRHLVYTHGYGVVASRVDRVDPDGQPSFIIRNVPPQAVAGGPQITDPRIYFGDQDPSAFIVVNSEQKELDYPQGDKFAETQYDGKGGIRLSGVIQRAAFAWRFRDVNMLISSAVTPRSKIIFRRSVLDRISRVAPFVRVDRDPYIVIADGRLKWMVDGYTTTSMYPYSQRTSFAQITGNPDLGSGNYIRNSVKFVVDALDGTVQGYVWDDADPVLKTWMKVFPGIFQPRAEMPKPVLDHVRYPEDLFKVQTDRYGSYHITNPDNFYSKEDAWLVAEDPTQSSEISTLAVPPYYQLVELPGEKGGADFVLVRPFTPVGRPNLTAYMVAKGDADEYGEIITYVFPKSQAIFGPGQVQSRINSDPEVSPFLTLNRTGGSAVIYGNLLVVPVEDSLLYVQPLYVKGQGSNLPELRRVVVVTGETVKMAPTLQQALALVFGRDVDIEDGETPTKVSLADLLSRAIEADRRAQAALRAGDFAEYGKQQAAMRRFLERAATETGATPAPSPSPSR